MRSAPKHRQAANLTAMVLLLLGTGLAALALLADRLDIGGGEGFGYQQMIVLIVGIVAMLGGVRIMVQPWVNRMTNPDVIEYER